MKYLEFAEKTLKDAGYRITAPRKNVLEVLNNADEALNAYAIAEKIKGADVSTVYRILMVLKDLELVHFVKQVQGYVKCGDHSCQESAHCHHQFVCESCGSTKEMHIDDREFLGSLKKNFSDLMIRGHYFEFLGLCKKCKS